MTIKTPLTKEQKDFIKKHKITEDLLLDANGEGMSDTLKQSMLDAQKVLAYNATGADENPEYNFVDTDGIFVQGDTDKIPFAARTYKTGYIYIAGSMNRHMIKVGSCNETGDRIKSLNISSSKTSGEDWELLLQAKTTTLGKVERLFQQKLSDYKSAAQFEKGSKIQNGGELYRCSYNKARDVMNALVEEEGIEFTQISEKKHLLSEFQFKNLKAKV